MKKRTDRYFQVYENYFWQWEEQNNVLAIPNGNTIAYRESVAHIMEMLSVQGLPPFGVLLLVIIATGQRADESLAMIKGRLISLPIENNQLRLSKNEMIARAFEFLEQLSQLPSEYKEKQKLILFQTIFQDCHNKKSVENSEFLVKEIKMQRISPDCYKKEAIIANVLNLDIRPLALLKERFKSNEIIIEAMRAIPQDIDIDLESEKEGDLISDLIGDPKTFYIGSLVKKLWGGLNIPMHYTATSQQQLGGVSDISNKGDFDKLFLSEFANEDEVFLSRLANNEALYINREAPPQNDNFNRYILIDISLRNWGTPKTIACAIMLALAKHPKSKMNYKVCLIGDHCYQMDSHSQKDIINIVDSLDPCLYPSAGLLDFYKKYTVDNSEVVLISNAATMMSSEMKALLNEYRNNINYLIYVESSGEIDVFRILKNSTKHIQSLVLNLVESWRKSPKEVPEKIAVIDSSETHPFRLLFVRKFDSPLMLLDNQGYFIDKGFLFRQVSIDKGWQIVFNNIDKGLSAYQIGHNEVNEPLLILCHDGLKKIKLLNLVTKTEITTSFDKGVCFRSSRIYFYQGAFYAIESQNGKMQSKENRYLRRISLDLQIEFIEDPELVKEIEENAASKISKYNQEGEVRIHPSVIMNVRHVALTDNNCLIINKKHVLKIFDSKLMFEHHPFMRESIKWTAEHYSDREFRFKNGIVLEFHYGLLTITLKDKRKIEIPLAIETNLALAVDDEVSGNPYFYRDNRSSDKRETVDRKMLDLLTSDDTWS